MKIIARKRSTGELHHAEYSKRGNKIALDVLKKKTSNVSRSALVFTEDGKRFLTVTTTIKHVGTRHTKSVATLSAVGETVRYSLSLAIDRRRIFLSDWIPLKVRTGKKTHAGRLNIATMKTQRLGS